MTEKQALLAAVTILGEEIEECIADYGREEAENDPYILEIKEAQEKLKEMYERMG